VACTSIRKLIIEFKERWRRASNSGTEKALTQVIVLLGNTFEPNRTPMFWLEGSRWFGPLREPSRFGIHVSRPPKVTFILAFLTTRPAGCFREIRLLDRSVPPRFWFDHGGRSRERKGGANAPPDFFDSNFRKTSSRQIE
jgi:hypothetical protein